MTRYTLQQTDRHRDKSQLNYMYIQQAETGGTEYGVRVLLYRYTDTLREARGRKEERGKTGDPIHVA